jgi:signal transduction histidine kinase
MNISKAFAFLANMNIRQRIISLIALAFVSLAVVGGVAVVQSKGSASEVKTVTEGVVPSAIKSVELLSQLKDVQIAVMNMVQAKEKTEVNSAYTTLSERKGELQQALEKQLAMADSKAQRGLVEFAQEALNNYFSAVDDTANFAKAGQREMAVATLSATVDQYLRELGGNIDTLQIEKARSKDQAINTVNNNLSMTTVTLTIITVFAVILLSSAGLILYRQIIHPIGDMEQKMTEIAVSQDFSQRLEVKRQDEIGKSIMAFNVMVEKIEESSELVRQKTADIHAMLANIPQGILTLVKGARIHHEYSDYLETLLETDRIAGLELTEVVFANTSVNSDLMSQLDATVAACIGEDLMNFEFNEHLLPREIDKTMPNGQVKILELSWSPITDEHNICQRLMLCVRDVTDLRALAKAAEAQKRELSQIGEILAVPQEKFSQFVVNALNFIEENQQLIDKSGSEPTTPLRVEIIGLLFRNMHTIKGNARTYGLRGLTNVVHECEQTYDDLRHAPDMAWPQQRLNDELNVVLEAVHSYAQISEHKLGRKSAGRLGPIGANMSINRAEIDRAMAFLKSNHGNDPMAMAHAIENACATLAVIGTEPLKKVLTSVIESLPSLAKELGKEPPVCMVYDNDIRVHNHLCDTIQNVFTHLYRNALDHGIETTVLRMERNKSQAGRIELAASLDEQHLELILSDDGAGLNLDAIAQKAVEKGLIGSPNELPPQKLAQLIFSSGFSTAAAVTEVSGRGVGMNAVKGFIEAEGGRIELLLAERPEPHGGTGFKTVIRLPAQFAFAFKSPSMAAPTQTDAESDAAEGATSVKKLHGPEFQS